MKRNRLLLQYRYNPPIKVKQILFTLAFLISIGTHAQSFDTYFTDQTLRLDYQFAGTRAQQEVYLQDLYRLPGWAGRRNHLSELPLAGNCQLTVKDATSGTILYRYSFSTLFSEWLDTDEALTVPRCFPNTYLIPYPKNKVEISIAFRTKKGEYENKITHIVDPSDILIRPIGLRNLTPHEIILQSGPSDKCIDIAFLAEGYREEEMDLYIKDVKQACEALFSHEPFQSMKNRFNVIAVKSASLESGVSIPRNKDWKMNRFGSHFDTFYSDRYLTSSAIPQINEALAGIPYEQIILLGNSEIYGGGGVYNSFTLADAHNEKTGPVVVHEFGHTFGGLADEYFYDQDLMTDTYPLDVEPWEQNITTQIAFASKWEDLYKAGKAGLYEGGGYSKKGIWRPMYDCRMRTNECNVFCPVCQRALTRIIEFYTQ